MSISAETQARFDLLSKTKIHSETTQATQAWLDSENKKPNPNQDLIDALTTFINQ